MSSQSKKTSNTSGGFKTNPFARALAETEKVSTDDRVPNKSPFSEFSSDGDNSLTDNSVTQSWAEQQQLEAKKQAKKEALRKKLHDQINPVDNQDVFNAREKQVKQEIEQIRHELKLLMQEISGFHEEIDISLMSNVAEPGTSGKYYLNFFKKLRTWIMLLRQKVHSATTWATQANNKKSKMKKRGGALIFEGKSGHEKTKTVFDMMHHEVANARSSG